MSNFFYVITIEENEKFLSFTETVNNSNNLISVFKKYKNAVTITPFKTKKEAKKTAEHWNKSYIKNNNHMYL